MLILTIDSSTKVGSVSLINDEKLIAENLLNLQLNHSPRLMPAVVDVLEKSDYTKHDLDGIGVTVGPGSFTGTRIGVAAAKSLAQSLELPIVGISTLEVLAAGLKYVNGYICPMIDARRQRVFSSLYQGAGQQGEFAAQTTESLLELDDLLAELAEIEAEIYFVGQIVSEYKGQIEAKINQPKFIEHSFSLPRAGALGDLALAKLQAGQEDDLYALQPNYLKRSQAEIQWAAKNN
mgnify:CR=1 FL=1